MRMNNLYLVQYSISKKTVIPHKANKLIEITSDKYVKDAKFWAPERTSKYGLKLSNDATHWGLFNLSDPDNPKLLISDEMPTLFAKKIWVYGKNYIIVRRTNHYMKFYVSPFKNVQSLKKSANVKEIK